MTETYILDGHEPVPCDDMLEWGAWIQAADRHVAQDQVGEIRVVTLFLGLDHNWMGTGQPILFETMIFGGEHDGYQERYCTWDEAVIGHKRALALQKITATTTPPRWKDNNIVA